MKKKTKKRLLISSIALLLIATLLLPDAQPYLKMAKDFLENAHIWVDFTRPDGWDSLGDAGITDDTSVNTEEVDEGDDIYEVILKNPEKYYDVQSELEELGVEGATLVHYSATSHTYLVDKQQYITVLGGNAATYTDENGKVQLVDNSLIETEWESPLGKLVTGVKNTANAFTATFPYCMSQDIGITVNAGSYKIEVIPVNGEYSHYVVEENSILYNGVHPYTDVQYTLVGNTIKEDIILHKPVENAVYKYVLKTPGLSAEIINNQVALFPEGKTIDDAVYILSAPFMEDAAGEGSIDIRMELTRELGKTILTVTPNKEWLLDESRQYPVRIDPTITNYNVERITGIKIYGTEQGSPEESIINSRFLYVGFDDGIKTKNLEIYSTYHMNCRAHFLIDTEFSGIPEDAKINKATLSIAYKSTFSKGTSEFALYTIDEKWPTSKYTFWKNQPKKFSYIGVQKVAGTKHTYVDYDITEVVSKWISKVSENNGLMLMGKTEAATLDGAQQCEIVDTVDTGYPPILSIEWSSAADPFLAERDLNDTTIELRPLTEKTVDGMLKLDGLFADGLATSGSIVEYVLYGDGEAVTEPGYTYALGEYAYPNSSDFHSTFPNAYPYGSKDSNWQSVLFSGLNKDVVYQLKACAYKEIDGTWVYGEIAESDTFVIYEVQQFDTLPKIAKHYGISLDTLMKDNRVQDTLVVAGNTLFIRNPQTSEPYNPGELSDLDKKQIDGALMGRGLHCEFGFEPINLNTGNFYMDQTDASLNDLGGQFIIGRTYNSLGASINSMFGRGWSFYYDQALALTANGDVVYKREDGSYLTFTKNADGSYSAPVGYNLQLKKIAYEITLEDETKLTAYDWEITDASQKKLRFDRYGVLTSITDVDGFVTTFDYDENYNLSKIVTPSGKEFHITLDEFGYITKIILPNGKAVKYQYDNVGNLIAVTNPKGDTRTYQYDDKHQMISWADENDNTVIQNTYDDKGRVVKQIDANGGVATLTYGKNTTTTVDNEGNKTIYKYDDSHRTVSITYPDGSACYMTYNSKNQLAYETTVNGTKTYSYDEYGNVATEIREDGAKATYQYNEQNKLLSIIGFDGGVVSYEYDSAGNMITYIQPDGGKVSYTYDNLHRMTSQTDARGNVTTYVYDGPNLVSYTDAEGHTWSFTYDEMNRQVTMSDPLGNTTKITYDNNGNKTSVTAPDGGRTTYQLDAMGNILTETDPLGHTTTYTYDKMYNILTATDALGNSVSYQYDKNGKQIQTTDAKGNVITYTRDCMGRVIKEESESFGTKLYEYDLAGNLVKVTDAEGNVTVSEYNTQGNVVKVTDALGNVTRYEYNALGKETQVIYADGGTITREYDSSARVIKQINELGVILQYKYDKNGNILTITENEGRIYTYEYDKNNKKIKETTPEGGVVTYTYDAAGRQLTYTNEEGHTESYTYDAAGRILSVVDALGRETKHTYDLNGNLKTSSDAKGNITSYTYDANGNMTSMTDPMGNITVMKYDELGKLSETLDALKGVTTYKYDAMGNMLEMTDALGHTYVYIYDKNGKNTSVTGPENTKSTMVYNANGQLVYMEDAAGLQVSYKYDKVGRLLEQKDNVGNETYYTYDKAGNILSKTDQLGRSVLYTYDIFGRLLTVVEADGSVTSYEYDVMNRVAAVTDAEGTRTVFTYDKLGNQLSVTEEDGATYLYTYDAGNRMTSTTDPLGQVETYVYDENNNLLSYTDKKGTVATYTYDANDNMLTVTDGNGGVTVYEYDELNRLILETSAESETVEYRYDAAGNLIKYKDATGAITQYRYDALGNMVESISPKGKSTIYTYDKHGNVLTVTDPLENVTSSTYNLNDQLVTMTQANGGVYTYEYDQAGRLIKVTSPLGFWTSFTYDLVDNVIEETNSLGQTTTYTYDRLHRMTKSVNAKGGISTFVYDIRNNLVSETNALGYTNSYAYDVLGRLIEEKNPLGQTTTYEYDPVGNLESILEPGGAKTTYNYDANYNVIAVADPLGNVTTYAYDKSNRLTGTTDALAQTETLVYDANGRVAAESDKVGNTTGYTYDLHGNVLTVTDRTGLNTHYHYDDNDNLTSVEDAAGNTTTYSYDSMGWLTTYVSALDKVTEYTYDLEGNQTSRTDATGRTENYQYDAAGRLITYTSAGGNITRYDYDELNQLVVKSYEDANGETRETDVLYGYNALGQRVSMTDAIGEAAYEYDALGRIISATDSAGQTVGYTYNEAGYLASIEYPDGSVVAYEYDLNGNLIKVTDGDGASTYYKYDALNRMTETIRPNYLTTYVTYDALDHITKLETKNVVTGRMISSYTYTYNEEGYVVSEVVEEAIVSELFEGAFEEFLDLILAKKDWEENETIQSVWQYFYEALHIGCDHNDADEDGEYDNCLWKQLTVKTEYNYYYDNNWQLTKCTEIGEYIGTITYEYWYDEDGNRTRYAKTLDGQNVEAYAYTYNDSNQLISRANQLGWTDSITYYTYDADGNMVTEQTDLWTTTYEYTAENRLSVVRQQGMVLMAALYDGDGNRLFTMDYTGICTTPQGNSGCGWEDCPFHDDDFRQGCFEDLEIWIPDFGSDAEDGETEDNYTCAKDAMTELASLVSKKAEKYYTITEYVNDITRENEEVLAELDVRGNVTSSYTYGYNRISEDLGDDIGDNTSYYLYDGLGSVTRVASEWGRVLETYAYDPYGNLTYGIPDSVNYYGYNGESTNLFTGLQYLRARYYDMANGSFITEDTVVGTQTEPLTRNRYSYASNNPTNRTDPSGHAWWNDLAKGVMDLAKKADTSLKNMANAAKQTITNVGTAIGNTVKKVADDLTTVGKKVLNTVSNAAQKVGTTIKKTFDNVVYAVTHPVETFQKATQVVQEVKEKVVTEGKKVVKTVSNAIENTAEVYQSAKSYVEKKAAEVHEKVKKAVCTSTNFIQEQLGKVDWESVGKVVAGGAIIAGLGVATVLTGGAVGVIAAGALSGAVISGGIGAVAGGVSSMASGGDFWKGAADGFLAGTITGAVSGAFTAGMGTVGGTILSNPIVQNTVESAVDVVSESAVTIAQGGEVSAMDMLGEFAFGAITGLDIPGGNKIDNALDAINTKQLKQATENFTEGVEELATSKQVKNTLEEVSESGIPSGYYQDANDRWHRPNGQFASNAEVGIGSTKVKSGSKTVTNPYGKKGGPAHQSVIEDIKTDADMRGLTYDTEYKYDTTGGYKDSRYADVVVYDSKGRVMEIHQVGRTTKRNGAPVSRERKAIRDIRSSEGYNGAKIIYHPYDR